MWFLACNRRGTTFGAIVSKCSVYGSGAEEPLKHRDMVPIPYDYEQRRVSFIIVWDLV